jgi:hypothetical protein
MSSNPTTDNTPKLMVNELSAMYNQPRCIAGLPSLHTCREIEYLKTMYGE